MLTANSVGNLEGIKIEGRKLFVQKLSVGIQALKHTVDRHGTGSSGDRSHFIYITKHVPAVVSVSRAFIVRACCLGSRPCGI